MNFSPVSAMGGGSRACRSSICRGMRDDVDY